MGPNPTDRAKTGVKRSLLVEADGGPLAVVVAGANVRDDKLLEATLDAVVVERPEPTEESPQHLCLDKGYDTRMAEEVVAKHSYVPHIRRVAERESLRRREPRSAIRRGGGWWSARWVGSRSAGLYWFVTRRKRATTSG